MCRRIPQVSGEFHKMQDLDEAPGRCRMLHYRENPEESYQG
jgi:hypothetical protein